VADFIYSSEGRPQGFRLSSHIFAIDGTPIGRVFAEKVYSFAGDYVGMLLNNMILDKPDVSRRRLPPSPAPARAQPFGGGEARRPVCEAFPDAFPVLLRALTAAGGQPQLS
jgi:hypothetical protein